MWYLLDYFRFNAKSIFIQVSLSSLFLLPTCSSSFETDCRHCGWNEMRKVRPSRPEVFLHLLFQTWLHWLELGKENIESLSLWTTSLVSRKERLSVKNSCSTIHDRSCWNSVLRTDEQPSLCSFLNPDRRNIHIIINITCDRIIYIGLWE